MTIFRRCAALLVALVTLTGCDVDLLPWSAPLNTDPIAARMTPDGHVEVLLLACAPVRVARLDVDGISVNGNPSDNPRVWQVGFPRPVPDTELRRVILGKTPPGGSVRIPWADSVLAEFDGFSVAVTLTNGDNWDVGFDMPALAKGRVAFHNDQMLPDEFVRQNHCP